MPLSREAAGAADPRSAEVPLPQEAARRRCPKKRRGAAVDVYVCRVVLSRVVIGVAVAVVVAIVVAVTVAAVFWTCV